MKKIIRFLSAALILAMVLALLPVSAFAAKENFVVNSVAVTGIDAPVAGKAPDTTATSNRSDCSITHVGWMEYSANGSMVGEMEAGDTFRHGYMYAVLVTVTLTSNRKFSSPTCTINGGSTELVLSQDKQLIAMYTFAPLPQAIYSVALTVVAPAAGKTPTFAKLSTTEYESKNFSEKISNQSNGCVWTNMASNVNLSVNNPFDASKIYAVTYTLYPKDGYTFTSATTATINGKTAKVNVRDGYLFVMLENLKPTTKTINPVTITNVTAPIVGKTPNYSIKATGTGFSVKGENNDYWTNGVAWMEYTPGEVSGKLMKKNATFRAGYRYAIVLDVVATDNTYSFVKNESTATVNGKTATLNPDGTTARMIYTFAELEPLKISNVSITVTAPTAGAKPSYTKIQGDGFHSEGTETPFKNGIGWFKTKSSFFNPGSTQTFEAGKSYILQIVLVAEDNYAFASNMTATVNGKKATVTVANGKAGLEVVLSTPAAEHKHTPSDWKSDEQGHWKECTASDCNALTTEKTMHTAKNGKCTVCGYQLPVEVPEPTEPTTKPEEPTTKPTEPVEDPTDDPVDDPTDDPVEDPTDDPTVEDPTVEDPTEDSSKDEDTTISNRNQKDDEDESGDKGNNMVLIIVLAAVAGLAIVGCVVLLLVKKKK